MAARNARRGRTTTAKKGIVMFDTMEIHSTPAQETASQRKAASSAGLHDVMRARAQAVAFDGDIPMLSAIRSMLALAVETAFDLRGGHAHSPHLDRFADMLDRQAGLLDDLKEGQFESDPALLMYRASVALDAFANAVREEIVGYVRPGIDPGAFNLALQRMTDRAIAAGAAFASLDLALARTI